MTPEQMLREIFGGTDEETRPRVSMNTTPVFRLAEVMPEFAGELARLLAEQGKTPVAASVADLWAFDRCHCESDHCATIYTLPRPESGYKGRRGGLSVLMDPGATYVDTIDGMIVCIEALDQRTVRRKLVDALP